MRRTYELRCEGKSTVKRMYAESANDGRIYCEVERVFETGYIFIKYFVKSRSVSYKVGKWNPQYQHWSTTKYSDKNYLITYMVQPEYQHIEGESYLTMQALVDLIYNLNIKANV